MLQICNTQWYTIVIQKINNEIFIFKFYMYSYKSSFFTVYNIYTCIYIHLYNFSNFITSTTEESPICYTKGLKSSNFYHLPKKVSKPRNMLRNACASGVYGIISINLRIYRFFWWKVVYVTVKCWSLVNHTIYKKEFVKIRKSFLQIDRSKVYRIILISPMIYINFFW